MSMTDDTLSRLFQGADSGPLIVGEATLTRDALLDFARNFDPQDFHLDEAAAQASLLRGLSASGWQSCALQHKIITTALATQGVKAACTSVPEVRWQQPLRPGAHVLVRATRTEPQLASGSLTLALEFIDTTVGTIMSQTAIWSLSPVYSDVSDPTEPSNGSDMSVLTYETLQLGQPTFLGARHFSPHDVRRFNADYDALAGEYVSPWHIGGNWMRAMIDHRHKNIAEQRANGQTISDYGPSPGIQNMQWCAQVWPDETLRFYTTPIARRTVSRPGWGLITSLNQAFNTKGRLVMQFNAQIFIQFQNGPSET